MRKYLIILAILSAASVAQANSYSTSFPTVQNPISESGKWLNGATNGTSWHNCRVVSVGFAIGTQAGNTTYDDSTCTVTGSWTGVQSAQITIHVANSASAQYEEAEVRLNTTITAGNITGYEVNCSVVGSDPYLQIVRWNGPLNNFTLLNSTGVSCGNNDILKATITSAGVITAYKNGTPEVTWTDTTYRSGAPGMGFYIQNGTAGSNNDFGASAFSASDNATNTAASCNGTDVQNAINATAAGGTVNVPAGTCTWPSGITLGGVSVIGAGKSTSGSVITSGTATITKNATYTTRLSGFRFTGTDNHITVNGTASNRAYIIDTSYFFSSGTNFMTINANGGLIYNNDFFMNPSSAGGPDVFGIHPGENWSQATTFGTADTQGPQGGERNIYLENNTFTNVLETAPDGDQGARLVIRYNTYTDSSIVFHSGAPNDTSTDGTRQFEIYNNTFHRVTSNDNMNKWVWARGGSGVIANNSFDSINTPDFGGKIDIRLGIGCSGSTYPVNHQIGQTVVPSTTPTQPLLIFGNTGAGTSDANWIVVNQNGTGGGGSTDCSNPSAFVQVNRDYYLSNTWGWTPFTYPHPLTGASAPAVSLSPSTLAFGNQLIHTTSAGQGTVLTNSGSATLTISGISVTGTNSGDFGQTNNCGATLGPSLSCTITVKFTPSLVGAESASVSITDNAGGSPHTVPLTGTGTGSPAATFAPTSIAFGAIVIHVLSAGKTTMLTNTGSTTLTINSISLTGTNSADFSQTNNCGASLGTTASCTITVKFTPSIIGAETASISVSDNATGSPQTVPLTGTGANAPNPPTNLGFTGVF